jgi:hypothetical protein
MLNSKHALMLLVLAAAVGCSSELTYATGQSVPAAAGTPAGAPEPRLLVDEPTGLKAADLVTLETPSAVLAMKWNQPGPQDFQTVEFYTPQGGLFLRQKQALDERGEGEARLVIRGGYIEEYNMVGRWTAKMYRNHATTPAQVVTFDITPTSIEAGQVAVK